MQINRNNFLRWSGALETAQYVNTAPVINATMLTGHEYVDIAILPAVISTFGVDVNSISAAVRLPAVAHAPRWTPETGILRIFRPTAILANMVVSYSFKDHLGNESNTGTVIVDLTLLALGWRAHPASLYCLRDAYNVNTGYKGYTQLEQYYTVTNGLYLPLTLIPNVPTDPAYIAPVVDTGACPLPSVAPFVLVNDTPALSAPGSPQIYINRVVLKKTGFADINLNSLTVYPGTNQTFSIPTGIYDSIDVYHSHVSSIAGLGYQCSYSPGNINTVTQALSVSTAAPNTFPTPTHAQPGSTVKVFHP